VKYEHGHTLKILEETKNEIAVKIKEIIDLKEKLASEVR
jgi:hypothetical protein